LKMDIRKSVFFVLNFKIDIYGGENMSCEKCNNPKYKLPNLTHETHLVYECEKCKLNIK